MAQCPDRSSRRPNQIFSMIAKRTCQDERDLKSVLYELGDQATDLLDHFDADVDGYYDEDAEFDAFWTTDSAIEQPPTDSSSEPATKHIPINWNRAQDPGLTNLEAEDF